MNRNSIFGVVIVIAIVGAVAFWFASKPVEEKPPKALAPVTKPEAPASTVKAAAPARRVSEPKPVVATGPGVIRGTVYDLDGKSVAADIEVQRLPSASSLDDAGLAKPIRTTCNEEGHFEVLKLPHGAFAVLARSGDGFALERVLLRPRADAVELTLVLYPGGVLEGSVVGDAGEPVAGARLTPLLHDGEEVDNGMTEGLAAVSDDEGHFAFASLHPRAWELRVSAEGYGSVLTPALQVGSTDNVVTLSRAPLVTGTVTHASDAAPLAGAVVVAQMKDLDAISARATTNKDGAFTFESLGPGKYSVDIAAGTLVLETGPLEFSIDAATEPGPLNLRVLDGGAVFGRISDGKTGEGIAGATLRARPKNKAVRRLETMSGDDGAFEFAGLSPGEYTIAPFALERYAKTGGQRQSATVSVQPGGVVDGVEIVMLPGAFVSGVVLDANDEPVAGARIDVNVEERGFGTVISSAADGTFAFADVDAGQSVMLRASGSQGVSESVDVVVPAEGANDVVLKLNDEATGSIAGTVVDKQGNPLAVQLYGQGEKSAVNRFVFINTSADGQFFVNRLAADDYTISARRKTLSGAEIGTVSLAPGQDVRGLRLVFPVELLSISGKVVNQTGEPVSAGLQLTLMDEKGMMPGGFAHSRHDGTFVADGLQDGLYEIKPSSQAIHEPGGVQARAGDTNVVITIEDAGGIEGRVVDATTQQPISTFEVALLTRYLPRNEMPGASEFRMVNDAQGRFSLTGDSESRIVVRADGYQPARLYSTPGKETVASLQPGDVRVEGRVLDSNGNGVTGVAVFVGPLSQTTRYRLNTASTRSGEGGAYEISGLASGSITVSAFDPEHGSGSASGEIAVGNSGPIDIHVQATGMVEGIIARGGEAVAQATVVLTDEAGATLRGVSDVDGHYVINDVAPGVATVAVDADGVKGEEQQVNVQPGERSTLDFDIAPSG